jgi:8-oxo-dGTP pyrophosphatase MutT (NUDIX family)
VSVQYAALPWRRRNDVLEFLLITTLTTRRWIVPKGWPHERLSPAECAAREALEEAGVVGEIAAKPIGAFHYAKHRKNGEFQRLRVELFSMEVMGQRRTWEEKTVRETCWCGLDETLVRVKEPGLKRLIQKFAKELRPYPL